MAKCLSCTNVLLPGEEALDRLKLGGLGSDAEVVLTDRRVLVSGPTDVLASHLALGPGSMVSGFPLSEFTSFVLDSGRRPLFFLGSLVFAGAGGVMLIWDVTRVPGLVCLAVSVILLLIWGAWRRTSLEISSRGLRLSGQVNPNEAIVFVERLQLAAQAARSGLDPAGVRREVQLSGRPRASCEVVDTDEQPQSSDNSVAATKN